MILPHDYARVNLNYMNYLKLIAFFFFLHCQDFVVCNEHFPLTLDWR